jgi:uncharacterized protein (DUF1697 family)
MALVVFLRGVNVGGHKTFRPSVLARELADLGVVNIGAAGTFVARNPITQARLRAELIRKLPFDTEIMICNGRDILQLMMRDPYAAHPPRPDIIRFVSILSRSPRDAPSPPLSFPADGRWMMKILSRHQRFVLGVHRREMKAISYLGQIDRLFGSPVTTRSWNTIGAVAKVLETGRARSIGKRS